MKEVLKNCSRSDLQRRSMRNNTFCPPFLAAPADLPALLKVFISSMMPELLHDPEVLRPDLQAFLIKVSSSQGMVRGILASRCSQDWTLYPRAPIIPS